MTDAEYRDCVRGYNALEAASERTMCQVYVGLDWSQISTNGTVHNGDRVRSSLWPRSDADCLRMAVGIMSRPSVRGIYCRVRPEGLLWVDNIRYVHRASSDLYDPGWIPIV